MAGRPNARVPKAAIDRRRAVIAAAIAALGPPLPGSLVERRTTCGNKGCRCHADPPQLHGPYLTWTRKVDNKTVTRTLDTAQADAIRPLLDNAIRPLLDNARRLRELTSELESLTLQQLRDDPAQPDP